MTQPTQLAKIEPPNAPIELAKQQAEWWTPTTLDAAMTLAQWMAKSQLVPTSYRGKPEDILAAYALGAPLGLSLLTCLHHIAVVNGKPSIWGDAALAVCRAHPAFQAITEQWNEGEGNALAAVCTVWRRGEEPVTREFSVGDAKIARKWDGMDCKEEGRASSPWVRYPRRMLQMRARAWALRDTFPDALCGMPVTEEIRDITDEVVVRDAVEPLPGETRTATLTRKIEARRAPKAEADEPAKAETAATDAPAGNDRHGDLLFRFEAAVKARAGGDDEKAAKLRADIVESTGTDPEVMDTDALDDLVRKMEAKLAGGAKGKK